MKIEIGSRINRMTVVSEVAARFSSGKRRKYFLCKCDCGNFKEVIIDSLSSRRVNSCGCYQKEVVKKGRFSAKHGLSNHPIFNTWRRMIDRCHNDKHKAFKNYGGRGISVCQEWIDSPNSFIKWAEENKWKKGLQIDRINNDKGYCPDNCRIVTRYVNQLNKRNIIKIKINGKYVSLKEACRIKGLERSYSSILRRYNKTGVFIYR